MVWFSNELIIKGWPRLSVLLLSLPTVCNMSALQRGNGERRITEQAQLQWLPVALWALRRTADRHTCDPDVPQLFQCSSIDKHSLWWLLLFLLVFKGVAWMMCVHDCVGLQ